MNEVNIETFIRIYDGALAENLCSEIIQRFEADESKQAGRVNSTHGNVIAPNIKQTTELKLKQPEWQDIAQTLAANLAEYLELYKKDVAFLKGCAYRELLTEVFRIKRYNPHEQFNWHIDCPVEESFSRVLAVQWYFNTVDEGGATEFMYQKQSVTPRAGRLVFFPVSWMYRHRGAPPVSSPKYICTNFLRPQF